MNSPASRQSAVTPGVGLPACRMNTSSRGTSGAITAIRVSSRRAGAVGAQATGDGDEDPIGAPEHPLGPR